MYKEKFVVAVKHNGRVLREQGDLIHIPFGSEYTLLFKNKNSVRALVRVEIDGQNATEKTSLIVPANGSIDLERFIKSGNMNQGNRFKFIERTKKIEDGPRGIGAEDGLIRIEFEFEREPTKYTNYTYTYTDQLARSWPAPSHQPFYGQLIGSTNCSTTLNSAGEILCSTNAASATTKTAQAFASNDVGITVPGSISDQKFVTGDWFPTDGVKHVMILKLLGEVDGKIVEKPVTVQAKPKCSTCGTVNKANAKFCRECGTALTLV